MSIYQIESANHFDKISKLTVHRYVVTRRPIGYTAILASFRTREEAVAWIAAQEGSNG